MFLFWFYVAFAHTHMEIINWPIRWKKHDFSMIVKDMLYVFVFFFSKGNEHTCLVHLLNQSFFCLSVSCIFFSTFHLFCSFYIFSTLGYLLCLLSYADECICTGNFTTGRPSRKSPDQSLALEVLRGRYKIMSICFVWHSSAPCISCFSSVFRSWLRATLKGERF